MIYSLIPRRVLTSYEFFLAFNMIAGCGQMDEKVTVIIPVYNYPEWLKESLQSVLGQTYPNIEIIAVSSLSTGDSIGDLAEEYGDKITHIKTRYESYGLMMNEALKHAKGAFIVYLNEGSILMPESLEFQVKVLEKNTDMGLVFSAYHTIDRDGNIQENVIIPGTIQPNVLLFLLCDQIFNGSVAMIRRECYQQPGLYIDSMAAKYDMWIRLARHYNIGVINKPLLRQRVYPDNDQLKYRARKDTQHIIFEALATIPLEEIFPKIISQPEDSPIRSFAHAAKGMILMMHGFNERAIDNFIEAGKIRPDISIHRMWMGLLSLRNKDYQTALNYFVDVPEGDIFFYNARWIMTLISRIQDASADVQSRCQTEIGKEYNFLMRATISLACGKALDKAQTKSDVAEEARIYLGWDVSRVFESLFDGTKMIADEWNRRSPKTPDDVINFYKEAENYIFDLAWWHRSPERQMLTIVAMRVCRKNGSQKVLDFGCGIGQDGITFAENGFDVTLADLSSRAFDFAKWRAERRKLPIKFVNSGELKDKYDAILCFDVLEHIWEPRETIEYLYNHLTDNGILLVTASFKPEDVHPMHLKQNARYLGEEFVKMMNNAGFRFEQEIMTLSIFKKGD